MNSTAYPARRSKLPGSTAAVRPSRAGYAMIEVILAFAVFGIGLAGLFPFVLTQLRLTRRLEARFQGDVILYKDAARQYQVYPNHQNQALTYYAVPWKNPRMRSLFDNGQLLLVRPDGVRPPRSLMGGAVLITPDNSNSNDDYQVPDPPPPPPQNAITIYSFQMDYPDTTTEPTITVNLDVEPK